MTCLYLWEFLFSGNPFCLFTGGSHKYARVIHWEVVITILLAPSLLSLVVAPSEMSPWEQTLSKVLVFEEVGERRVSSLPEPKGRRGVLPAARRDRSIVTENVCVVVSAEQHLVIIRETSLSFGGLKTPVHLMSICKYIIMRYEQFLLRLVQKCKNVNICVVSCSLLLWFLVSQHFNSSIWQLLTRCDGN